MGQNMQKYIIPTSRLLMLPLMALALTACNYFTGSAPTNSAYAPNIRVEENKQWSGMTRSTAPDQLGAILAGAYGTKAYEITSLPVNIAGVARRNSTRNTDNADITVKLNIFKGELGKLPPADIRSVMVPGIESQYTFGRFLELNRQQSAERSAAKKHVYHAEWREMSKRQLGVWAWQDVFDGNYRLFGVDIE